MKAVILAGGFGTRLRPLTIDLCKPMAPVANRPMMEHVVRLCAKYGFEDLLVMLHYSPEMIQRYFESGKNWDVQMSYLRPDVDLGTAGCIRFAADDPSQEMLLKDPFLVISGDVLTDLDLKQAWNFHKEKKAAATLVLTRTVNPLPYGVVILDENSRISRFMEKPTWGEVFSDTINTGVYILSPEVLKHIPQDTSFDFSKHLFPKLMELGLPVFGYVADGYWKDVGDLTEYRTAQIEILENLVAVKPYGEPHPNYPGIRVGENCQIETGVIFEGNSIIGKNSRIVQGAHITQSVIGDNVRIGSGASIRRSVIWDRCFIGPEVALREAVVGRSVRIGQRTRIEVGAIIGNRCEIGSDAVIQPSVKMWPEKMLEDGAVLASSLVWGERWNKQLFGNICITGLANIEITPEFGAKFGAAFGAMLGPGSYVITSRDTHKASRLIKRAIISGLMSSGVRVGDLRMVPVPVIRYEMGQEGESGGIHVRMSPLNPRQVDIRVFSADGRDLPIQKEKAIEQLFMREDFKRAAAQDVGDITIPPRAIEYWRTGVMKNLNAKIFERRRLKVIIDYAHSTASQILPDLLGQLGVESVSINADASSTKVTRNEDEFKKALSELAHIVTTLKADMGFLMDNGVEKLFLVDGEGHVVPPEEALVLIGLMAMQTSNPDVIAYPVQGSTQLEKQAATRGISVLRTPVNPRQILEYARRPNVGFVGDGEGGFIFSAFQPAFDAMYASAKILEMLLQLDTSFAEFRAQWPLKINVLHRRVPCSWDQKGRVMRLAQNVSKDQKLELIDGVKIHQPDGWVLVLPDGNEAYCHLWAEASNEKTARQYIDEYTRHIEDWQKPPESKKTPPGKLKNKSKAKE